MQGCQNELAVGNPELRASSAGRLVVHREVDIEIPEGARDSDHEISDEQRLEAALIKE